MATNHTTNYALNLWEANDKFVREEFNENTSKLDAAIKAEADARAAAVTAETNARTSALTALTQTVNGKGNCKIVTGQYTGNGYNAAPVVLTFDHKPLLVLVAGGEHTMVAVRGDNKGQILTLNASLTCTWTGNSVTWASDHRDYSAWAYMNSKDSVYTYIAFLEM